MAVFTSYQVTNKKYFPAAAPHSAREVHCVVSGLLTMPVTAAADDVGLLVALPANCIPVDCVLISTDLDTDGAPAMVIDVGILDTTGLDLVATSELIDASDVCQAGGTARMDSINCALLPATWLAETLAPDIQAEKIVALKVVTVAATKAAGTVYFELFYRAAESGI